MASLMAKTVRGHTYWQIVESRRINGKPRPIVLAHLGKADDLLRRLQQLDRPYTALIRALRPGPKTRLAQWYQGTVLSRLLPIPAQQLSSQRFWDHFDYLDAD